MGLGRTHTERAPANCRSRLRRRLPKRRTSNECARPIKKRGRRAIARGAGSYINAPISGFGVKLSQAMGLRRTRTERAPADCRSRLRRRLPKCRTSNEYARPIKKRGRRAIARGAGSYITRTFGEERLAHPTGLFEIEVLL